MPMSPQHTTPSTWQDSLLVANEATRQRVAAAVNHSAERLAELFYAELLSDAEASKLLDHAIVNTRLRASMASWLRHLFSTSTPHEERIGAQQRTGEIHARIGVPMHLVSQGARIIKRTISHELVAGDMPRDKLAEAIQYVYELMDLAIDTMNAAYAANASRLTRSEESYRLFFMSQNMKAERERQKSDLLEWAQQIFVKHYWDVQDSPEGLLTQEFGSTQFGLWLHHKAAMIFDGAPEIALILQSAETIERELLPRLGHARASREDARAVVAAITEHVDRIKTLLANMFDRYVANEDGRDGVTRLLNRRYFPSVARREIALAQQHHSTFAVMIVDIDHFAVVRESLGADVTDLLLSQVAEALQDKVRAGDFLFRVGDDQFLVLLVEAHHSNVMKIAESLRRCVEALRLQGSGSTATSMTVSIGVCLFDGHPDYQHLLDKSNEALVEAKAQGRNRCVLAES